MNKNFDPNKTDVAFAKAIDQSKEADDNLIRLSTGVILEAHQVNPNILIRVMAASPRPEPPVIFMKDMGREMENPDDPDYISRVQAWQLNYANGMLNVLVGLGTTLVELPKGMSGPYEEDWLKDYKLLGLPIHPESPAWLYTTWVLFKAAVNEKDNDSIQKKVNRLSGVKEEAVQAAESFPGSDETHR